MKNECSIVKDLLPLYIENMVSEDSARFLEEHIKECDECADACDKLKEDNVVLEVVNAEESKELTSSFKNIRKKLWKRVGIVVGAICMSIAVVIVALQIFPIYRVFQNAWDDTFTISERKMLAFIGTPGDIKIARSVINQAEIAFSDTSAHTYEENIEKYGELGRYTFSSDYFEYFNAVTEKHTIKLLSVRADDNHGYIFVKYRQEAVDGRGETIAGSWDIVSLWEIEKDSNGNWTVIDIREHA